jgi:hypothetical protein
MKLTRKDIKNFATEDEQKKLTEAGKREPNFGTLAYYEGQLKHEIEDIQLHYQWEDWDELSMVLESALDDVNKIIELSESDEEQEPVF